MSKLDFQKIFNRLKREINYITQFSIINYKTEMREDAQQVILSLKPQIDEWISKLNNKELSCAELYCLIQLQKNEIQLKHLLNTGISDEEVTLVKSSILQLVSNTIINSYLNSLFETQDFSKTTLQEKGSLLEFF
ncbi:MAG: hypothetical protein Q7U47_04950 [Paludibacter sp.]|nr:hypothetical protein [Paludibacter sp.]